MQWHLLPSTNKSCNHRFSVHFTSWWVFAFDNKKLNMLKINKRGKRNQQHFVLLVSERQKGLRERERWKIKSTVCGRERRTMCRMWALAGAALCLLLRLALCHTAFVHYTILLERWGKGKRHIKLRTWSAAAKTSFPLIDFDVLIYILQNDVDIKHKWIDDEWLILSQNANHKHIVDISKHLVSRLSICLANRQEYFYAFVSLTDVICDSYQMWIVMGVQFEVLW